MNARKERGQRGKDAGERLLPCGVSAVAEALDAPAHEPGEADAPGLRSGPGRAAGRARAGQRAGPGPKGQHCHFLCRHPSGVVYRNSPHMDDRVEDGKGPNGGDVLDAEQVAQVTICTKAHRLCNCRLCS